MKRFASLKQLTVVILALGWLHGDAPAATINWYSEWGATLLTSQQGSNPGDSLTSLDSSFVFEIGTFGNELPENLHVSEWAANWKVLDHTLLEDDGGNLFFTSSFSLDADNYSESAFATPGYQFVQGQPVYIWVYNSQSIEPGSEWALVRDGGTPGFDGSPWIIPGAGDSSNFEFDVQYADQVVYGGANNVQGEGEYGDNVPLVFHLQTAVVPEPGSALLVFSAAAALLTRRVSRRISRTPLD